MTGRILSWRAILSNTVASMGPESKVLIAEYEAPP